MDSRRKEVFEQYCEALRRREEAEVNMHIASIDFKEANDAVDRLRDELEETILTETIPATYPDSDYKKATRS